MDKRGPILITGVNGFIASHLAERLLREGQAVRGLARQPERAARLAAQGVQVIGGELLDREALKQAIDGCRAVVHAAAWTGGPELSSGDAWRVNVEGTAAVLLAAKQAGVRRFLFISSVAVYGLNKSPVIDETAPTPPVGQLYPDSKIAAEALVRSEGVPFVIARPACTYGPRGGAWTIGPIEQIKQGRLVLLGEDRGLVTPGYIENVVDGLWLALIAESALGNTFNLCDDYVLSYREFYLTYARMLGIDTLPTLPSLLVLGARLPGVNRLRRAVGRPAIGRWSLHFRLNPSKFSIERARRILGYQPDIGFSEGMRRTETWLRAAGYI